MCELRIRKMANSLGAGIPREARARPKAAEGEHVLVAETRDGYRMPPNDPEFERQMEHAKRG